MSKKWNSQLTVGKISLNIIIVNVFLLISLEWDLYEVLYENYFVALFFDNT